ncbi:MAG: DNA replication/repair protein RecF [Clostridia bacterium]|jgi:DNA replication and repair protein RecF|nr:DNA replication/repair protein RecF [Clostridia bacterium]
MHINNLILKNFRSYENLNIKLNDRLNIFVGNNAMGKTNILESIYLCATGKSHRTNYDKEMISWNENESHIQLNFEKDNREERINLNLRKNYKKGAAINGIVITKIADLIGNLNVVIFSPEDLRLIKDGPGGRRKYINTEISQISKIYFYNLNKYNKILKQRNNLLKRMNYKDYDRDSLEVWNVQLIEEGKKIIDLREEYINKLKVIVKDVYKNISGDKEEIELDYEKSTTTEKFEINLNRNIEKDIRQGYSSVGPHLDDIVIKINNVDIRKYGSQGQQRTAALSLKFAEIELIKKELNEVPILLLDDVFSELDRNRQKYLLKYIEEVQTILTCTGVEDILKEYDIKNNIFYVNNGIVSKT